MGSLFSSNSKVDETSLLLPDNWIEIRKHLTVPERLRLRRVSHYFCKADPEVVLGKESRDCLKGCALEHKLIVYELIEHRFHLLFPGPKIWTFGVPEGYWQRQYWLRLYWDNHALTITNPILGYREHRLLLLDGADPHHPGIIEDHTTKTLGEILTLIKQ
jgi:hypothetical protein